MRLNGCDWDALAAAKGHRAAVRFAGYTVVFHAAASRRIVPLGVLQYGNDNATVRCVPGSDLSRLLSPGPNIYSGRDRGW